MCLWNRHQHVFDVMVGCCALPEEIIISSAGEVTSHVNISLVQITSSMYGLFFLYLEFILGVSEEERNQPAGRRRMWH